MSEIEIEIGGAILGFLIIGATVWQIVKQGIAPGDGRFDEDWRSASQSPHRRARPGHRRRTHAEPTKRGSRSCPSWNP